MVDFLLPPVSGWDEWRELFTDEAVWRPVVTRLWAREPGLAARTGVAAPESVVSGFPGTCAVFIVNDAIVVKFFPPMVADDWRRERAVYRLLTGRVPEMPRLLASGYYHDRIAWPYLVTSFLPGAAWRDARMVVSAAERLAIGRLLGERLRQVHDVPVPVNPDWPPDTWPRLVTERLEAAPAELLASAALPEPVVAAALALLRDTDWFAGPPRLLHGDLTEDHILVSRADGRWTMTGLIDWADAEVADPAYEWAALYFGFCGREALLFRAVQDGYGPAARPPPPRRLLAGTLLHRFGARIIADALPESVRRGLRGLDELEGALFAGYDG